MAFCAGPYAAADAYCTTRCSADAECGAGKACYIPSDRRWNHQHPATCPPTSKFNSGCGCCTSTGLGDDTARQQQAPALPAIPKLTVNCGDSSVAAAEGYELTVTSDAVTITASTSQGAAYGLTTLAQLLRYDTALASGVLDFVPLHIKDAPRFSWRGQMCVSVTSALEP